MKNRTLIGPHWGNKTHPDRAGAVLRHTAPGDHILDLGSGRGAYTELLNSQDRPTVGVDIISYTEWLKRTPPRFSAASAYALPFPSRSFHTTICFETLEHCPEPHLVLREIARCTRHYVILTVPNCDLKNALRRYNLTLFHWTDRTHCNFFTKESLQELLSQEGYAVKKLQGSLRISPNDYFWDTLRLPNRFTNRMKRLCERFNLVETYWSSMLAVAQVPRFSVTRET
jgi:SAM-dependent methyltransferase